MTKNVSDLFVLPYLSSGKEAIVHCEKGDADHSAKWRTGKRRWKDEEVLFEMRRKATAVADLNVVYLDLESRNYWSSFSNQKELEIKVNVENHEENSVFLK